MKRRLFTLLVALLFLVQGVIQSDFNVRAEDKVTVVGFETLLTEDSLIGYSNNQTRGVYLAEGYSVINNAGGGKIGCGGITNAAKRCRVSVNAIVEQKVNGSWIRVTSWSATNTNALTVSISKTLSVASGYYYRVRCNHTAGTDGSSSYTSALWM